MSVLEISDDKFMIIETSFPGFTSRSVSLNNRSFRSLFGATPRVCSIIWHEMILKLPTSVEGKHLFRGLLFLKVYSTEEVHSAICGTTVKTFRKWSLKIVTIIYNLSIVS